MKTVRKPAAKATTKVAAHPVARKVCGGREFRPATVRAMKDVLAGRGERFDDMNKLFASWRD